MINKYHNFNIIFAAMLAWLPFQSINAENNINTSSILSLIQEKSKDIFQNQKGSYLYPNGDKGEQMAEIFGKLIKFKTINSKLIYINACRIESCDEAGSIIFDKKENKIVALEIRTFHCSSFLEKSTTKTECLNQPIIDSFIFKKEIDKNKIKKSDLEKIFSDFESESYFQKKIKNSCYVIEERAECSQNK